MLLRHVTWPPCWSVRAAGSLILGEAVVRIEMDEWAIEGGRQTVT
jgi:hypothetical protein